jgi:hypothetical protein
MAADKTPKTLLDAIRYYSDLDVCQQELVDARWPDGVECPTCGSKSDSYLTNQRRWQCKNKHPRRQFSVKVGTIFEDSPIGLDKWFAAMWMIAGAKNGISSYEVHRALGVTQKTAWFMLHRIRLAMQTKSFLKIDGEAEVDETYIGGKARNMHKGRRERIGLSQHRSMLGKVAVMGLLERHGAKGHSTIRLEVVQGRKRHHLRPAIDKHVENGATIHTDSHPSYTELGSEFVHHVIDHAEKYVEGNVHTNGCENFWSLLKRAIKGTYVSVEPFHLFRYLDEQAYRFNNRKDDDGGRFAGVLGAVTGRRIMYRDLIAKQPA